MQHSPTCSRGHPVVSRASIATLKFVGSKPFVGCSAVAVPGALLAVFVGL
jgi:hypothetical protein